MTYRKKWSGLPPGRPKKDKIKRVEGPGEKWNRIMRGMRVKGLLFKSK